MAVKAFLGKISGKGQRARSDAALDAAERGSVPVKKPAAKPAAAVKKVKK